MIGVQCMYSTLYNVHALQFVEHIVELNSFDSITYVKGYDIRMTQNSFTRERIRFHLNSFYSIVHARADRFGMCHLLIRCVKFMEMH